MAEITIGVSDQQLDALRDRASESGLSVEEFLGRCLDEWLASDAREFTIAADYVLRKNAELYQRLG